MRNVSAQDIAEALKGLGLSGQLNVHIQGDDFITFIGKPNDNDVRISVRIEDFTEFRRIWDDEKKEWLCP